MRRKKPKLTFAVVLHLAELYCDQYNERGLCLSPEQNEVSFKDFVWQYTSSLYWEKPINLVINPEATMF